LKDWQYKVKLIFQDHKEYDDKKLYGFARSGSIAIVIQIGSCQSNKLIEAECHFGEEVIKNLSIKPVTIFASRKELIACSWYTLVALRL